MAVPLRKRLRRGARSLALRVLAALLGRLPLRAALAVGALAGRLAWHLAPGTRRLMLAHLALAFPEKSEAERRAVARASLVHLGQVALEVAALRRYRDRLEAYVSIAPGGAELVERAMARGRGLVFVAGHIGNWELLAQRLSRLAQPNAVVAKRNADAWLNGAVERLRAEGGLETFWREDPATGRRLLRLFKRGGGLGILVDQDTKVQGVFAPFFGRPAFTPRAAADLALRFGATALVVTSHRRGPGRGAGHELEVVELPYDPAPPDREAEVLRFTAAALAIQEAAIRRHPAEWVWMHRRWKTEPPLKGSLASAVPKSRELSGT
ncbi:lysophospholipid acyltransferase family protein [Anaeromyxobacter diazotrophicus]|nr:lipid A biosynthesis acyltransferase [Anaeromyxobacter diazotrophicus]